MKITGPKQRRFVVPPVGAENHVAHLAWPRSSGGAVFVRRSAALTYVRALLAAVTPRLAYLPYCAYSVGWPLLARSDLAKDTEIDADDYPARLPRAHACLPP